MLFCKLYWKVGGIGASLKIGFGCYNQFLFIINIDAVVNSNPTFRITLFYGNPRVDRRNYSWDLLRLIETRMDIPWTVFGDFNEILYSWEMKGSHVRCNYQMSSFRKVLMDCGLVDIGCDKGRFTFSNKPKMLMKPRQDWIGW